MLFAKLANFSEIGAIICRKTDGKTLHQARCLLGVEFDEVSHGIGIGA